MKSVRNLFVVVTFLFAMTCLGLANTVYISQAGGSFSGGSACKGQSTQTTSYFNTSTNWTSGTPSGNQIGPGTTVYLCGTFTSSTQGGTLLTAQGNGTSSAPVHVLADTGMQANSTGWWGSSGADECMCTGALNDGGHSYIIFDGGVTGTNTPNGIIQNMLAGSPGNTTCVGGTCTQVPGNSGSTLVSMTGNNNIVENWNLIHVYQNSGSSSSATDTGGQFTWNIADSGMANLYIYNNVLNNASAAILDGSTSTASPNNCPTSGLCVAWNTMDDHHWMAAWHGTGVITYNNLIGSTSKGLSNWFYPSSIYHQDGWFTWGPSYVTHLYSINDTFVFNICGGSPSGFIYFANADDNVSGTGSAGALIGDTIVNTDPSCGYDISVGQAPSGTTSPVDIGPIYEYNNTYIGGQAIRENFGNYLAAAELTEAMGNNIFLGEAGTSYYTHVEGGNVSAWASGGPASDYDAYYSTSGNPNWQDNSANYTSFSAWQAAGHDAHGINSNPNLTSGCLAGSALCTLPSGSPAIGAGENLATQFASLNLNNIAMTGPPQYPGAGGSCGTGCVARSSSGAWDIGAYPYGTTTAAAAPAAPSVTVTAVN